MRLPMTAYFLLLPLLAQQFPDATELLKQNGEALKKYRSYQYENEMAIDMVMGGNPMRMDMRTSMAVVNPDKMRVESKGQMGGSTMVADGDYTWIYIPALNQYTKKAAIRGPQALLESIGIGAMSDASKVMMGNVKTIREELIEVDGDKLHCWVLETKVDKLKLPEPSGAELTDGVITFWIDKDLKINRQVAISGKMQGGSMPAPVEMKGKIITRALKLDADLPNSLFTFAPPEGAKEVAEFGFGGMKKPDLAGKPTPEFRVKSLHGETLDSASLRGKAILLDFWATWCSPCRKEMPTVEKIHQEFKDKGLVVLGLNVGEALEVVEQYLKTAKVTYPVALTMDSDIVPAFQVTAFPTYVVIDQEGKIVAYQVGSAGEAALREAVAKAGLKMEPTR
jgi:thiol-disulfide isomerase/thioredoxin